MKLQKKDVERYFDKMNVITNYGDNFKRYRIDSVDFSMTPNNKFPDKKYADYK